MAKTYQNVWTNLKPETQARLSFSTRAKGPAMATLIASLKNISSWPVGSCKDTAGPASKQRHLMASTVKKYFMARSKFPQKKPWARVPPHWPAQSAKMCVCLVWISQQEEMPKKSVDYLGLSCLTSKSCALRFTSQNRKKNPTQKIWTLKLPKDPYRKKKPRFSMLTGTGFVWFCQGNSASGCSCSSQKRSLLSGPRTFVVVKVVSPLHVCRKNNTMAQKWPSKQKKMNW